MYQFFDFIDSLMGGGIIGFLVVVFIGVWFVLWLFLPFYVHSINEKLKNANELLATIGEHLSSDRKVVSSEYSSPSEDSKDIEDNLEKQP